ncbi:aa3-type cytochrome c oxidase subunit IV [Devosia rhodophyticola]|uniref:Aa3-type cytochrome c oxidase subunit IV n=1 Tax=Devosia rhodophyticola TaxID=3026423 RepID=A0ABY7YU97_9HYPH|nr:aa3-type cytochrome c oxidase subunit IV [Devosia rhodophyticola]WDR04886.1 aa3-type cytochrome c oxidase subunit IV [Devosia rhodophyticola]
MANNHEPLPPMVHESAMDYKQHEQTYNGFVTLVKYSIITTAVVVVILYFWVQP